MVVGVCCDDLLGTLVDRLLAYRIVFGVGNLRNSLVDDFIGTGVRKVPSVFLEPSFWYKARKFQYPRAKRRGGATMAIVRGAGGVLQTFTTQTERYRDFSGMGRSWFWYFSGADSSWFLDLSGMGVYFNPDLSTKGPG